MRNICALTALKSIRSFANDAFNRHFLINRKVLTFQFHKHSRSCYSVKQPPSTQVAGILTSPGTDSDVEFYTYVSLSRNVFCNLSLEDWIEKNVDLTRMNVLLLWRNDPCVVIGRHQNSWQECNISQLHENNVLLARRRSGGGCVYHDIGNVNCTFFTSKGRYDRKKNLRLVADLLKSQYDIPVDVTDRDDLFLFNEFKVSGTAARLTKVAFHHFTLLIDMHLDNLSSYLSPSMDGLSSKATESVRSKVKNLKDVCPDLSYHSFIEKMAYTFTSQGSSVQGYSFVDPSKDVYFPGIDVFYQELKSWQWIYGKTPKFSVSKTFTKQVDGLDIELGLTLNIEKGLISRVNVDSPHTTMDLSKIFTELLSGVRFWRHDVIILLASFLNQNNCDTYLKYVANCIEDIFAVR